MPATNITRREQPDQETPEATSIRIRQNLMQLAPMSNLMQLTGEELVQATTVFVALLRNAIESEASYETAVCPPVESLLNLVVQAAERAENGVQVLCIIGFVRDGHVAIGQELQTVDGVTRKVHERFDGWKLPVAV